MDARMRATWEHKLDMAGTSLALASKVLLALSLAGRIYLMLK
jgi:hypothetical protein